MKLTDFYCLLYSGQFFCTIDGSNLSIKKRKNGQRLAKEGPLRKPYHKGRVCEDILPQIFKKYTIKYILVFSSREKALKCRFLLSCSKNVYYLCILFWVEFVC